MAQRSKKDHIVESALPLFLVQGFKGTSIDMVVKASGVSKPTVYNHFPDKSALMLAVVRRWVDAHKPLIVAVRNSAELDAFIDTQWLTPQAVRIYAIVIGEGWRFPAARQLFWQRFDHLWRDAFAFVAEQCGGFDRESMASHLDGRLIERLRAQTVPCAENFSN